MKSPIQHPSRNFSHISENTKRIIASLGLEKAQLCPPIRENDTLLLVEAMKTGNFTDEGLGIYKESYQNQDYGKIWVKKTVINEKTGQKEDWLVKFVDDNEDIIRQVASEHLAGLRKVASHLCPECDKEMTYNDGKDAYVCSCGYKGENGPIDDKTSAANVASDEWISNHLPKGWQKMKADDVAMHLLDQADSLEGNEKADVSLNAMKMALNRYKMNKKEAATVDPKNIPIAQGIKSKNITMDETGGGGTAKVTVEFTDPKAGLDFYQNKVDGGGKSEPKKDDTDQLADEMVQEQAPKVPPQPQGTPQPQAQPPMAQASSLNSDMAHFAIQEQPAEDQFGQQLFPQDQVRTEEGRVGVVERLDRDVAYVHFKDVERGGGYQTVNQQAIPFLAKELIKHASKTADHLEDTPVSVDIHIEGEPSILDNLLDDLLKDIEGDKLEGGAGDEVEVEDLDQDELEKGVEHEKEHTSDDDIAEEIASDHLSERKQKGEKQDYYEDLDEMEKKNEKEASKLAFDNGFNTVDTNDVAEGDTDPEYKTYKTDCEVRGEQCQDYNEWLASKNSSNAAGDIKSKPFDTSFSNDRVAASGDTFSSLQVKGFDEFDPYNEDGASTDASDWALNEPEEPKSVTERVQSIVDSHPGKDDKELVDIVADTFKVDYKTATGYYIQWMKGKNNNYEGSKLFSYKTAADVSDEVPPASWTEKESHSWKPEDDGIELPPNPNLNQNPGDVLYDSNNAQQQNPAKFQVTTDPVNKSVEVKWVDNQENLQQAVQPQAPQQPPQYQVPQAQPQGQQKPPLVRDIPNVPEQKFQDQESQNAY